MIRSRLFRTVAEPSHLALVTSYGSPSIRRPSRFRRRARYAAPTEQQRPVCGCIAVRMACRCIWLPGSSVKPPTARLTKQTLPYSFGRRVWTSKAGNRLDQTGWHFKAPLPPRPLYGLDRLAARPQAPVMLLEGEKAADAAGLLFPDYVAICSQGGSNAAAKADWG